MQTTLAALPTARSARTHAAALFPMKEPSSSIYPSTSLASTCARVGCFSSAECGYQSLGAISGGGTKCAKGSGTRSSVRANRRYESAAVGGISRVLSMGRLYNSFTWNSLGDASTPRPSSRSLKYFPCLKCNFCTNLSQRK